MSKITDVTTFIKEVRGKEFPERPRFITEGLRQDRINFMQEELDEFKAAETLEDQVDALIDLQYFLLGTVYEMGITEEQYNECWSRVHAANMNKKAGKKPGRSTRTVDACKPDDFKPPTFEGIFDGHGETRR